MPGIRDTPRPSSVAGTVSFSSLASSPRCIRCHSQSQAQWVRGVFEIPGEIRLGHGRPRGFDSAHPSSEFGV